MDADLPTGGDGVAASRARSPWRTWWLGGLALTGLCMALAPRSLDDLPVTVVRRVTEVWIVGGVAAYALRGLPWRPAVDAVGRPRALVIGTVVALMGATQFTNLPGAPYPFSQWDMYSRSTSSATYVELLQVDAQGGVEPLSLVRVLPVITPRPFMARLGGIAHRHDEGDDDATALLRETVLVLGHRSDHPTDSIEVRRCEVREPTLDAPSTCRVVMTVDLAADDA